MAFSGLISSFILLYILLSIIKRLYLNLSFYPQIYQLIKSLNKATRFNIVIIIGFLIGNVLYIIIKVKNTSRLIDRTSLISTINLIPLFLKCYINLIVSHYGIIYKIYSRIHQWLERVTLIKGFIYFIIVLFFLNGGNLHLVSGYSINSKYYICL